MTQLRAPTVSDLPRMLELMAPHVAAGRLLPRSPRELLERLRDYTVIEEQGALVGVGSVALIDMDLAEIGVLVAMRPELEIILVEHLLGLVSSMGIGRAFLMTDSGALVEAEGFRRVPLDALPAKRDRQCLRCSLAPRCRQEAFEIAIAAEGLRVAS